MTSDHTLGLGTPDCAPDAHCPECGGVLRQASRLCVIRDGKPTPVDPPGAWCTQEGCSYGALSVTEPNIPHPRAGSAEGRQIRRAAHARQHRLCAQTAARLSEVVSDPDICGGRPVYSGSRLTVETVCGLILAGEEDSAILSSYDRLDADTLARTQSALASALAAESFDRHADIPTSAPG